MLINIKTDEVELDPETFKPGLVAQFPVPIDDEIRRTAYTIRCGVFLIEGDAMSVIPTIINETSMNVLLSRPPGETLANHEFQILTWNSKQRIVVPWKVILGEKLPGKWYFKLGLSSAMPESYIKVSLPDYDSSIF